MEHYAISSFSYMYCGFSLKPNSMHFSSFKHPAFWQWTPSFQQTTYYHLELHLHTSFTQSNRLLISVFFFPCEHRFHLFLFFLSFWWNNNLELHLDYWNNLLRECLLQDSPPPIHLLNSPLRSVLCQAFFPHLERYIFYPHLTETDIKA